MPGGQGGQGLGGGGGQVVSGGLLDIDPPAGAFALAVAAAALVRQALADAGLTGAVKTSGAKGLHVFVSVSAQVMIDEAAAATRALAARAECLDPALATTAFISSARTGRARCSSIPPAAARRPWCRRTAHGSGQACRCPSR